MTRYVVLLFGGAPVIRSTHSVTTAFELYGTPFFRRYPPVRFRVTTFRLPARPAPRPPTTSQLAIETPCSEGGAAGGCCVGGMNCKWRVWVPASVSTFNVVSFSQLI